MFKLIVFSSCLLLQSHAFQNRIVNGTDAYLGEIPYIVSLQKFNKHSCGGSILDATHILTAAHCIIDGYPIQIQYGFVDINEDTEKINVIKQVAHADYIHGGNYANDIAVLTLEKSIKFSDNVKPTVLPKQDEATPEQKPSILAGWGYLFTGGSVSRFLQRVDLLIYSEDDCVSAHHGRTDPKIHICSGVYEGGKGQCSGDSGGPLYADGKQVGVVSWSVKPCGIKGYPGVFVKVSNYIDWIDKQVQK